MILAESIKQLQVFNETLKKGDFKKTGYVPTMGALHKGHESLIRTSINQCDYTIVSIFINPTQFGENEDYHEYPRQQDKDIALCKELGVDVVFIPSISTVYPDENFDTNYKPDKKLTKLLCGKTRMNFFEGVCNVVGRLLTYTNPTHAYFGDKDLQQRIIIQQMVKDLNLPVQIIGLPIIRDKNGLALSSRNEYLSVESYKKAIKINHVLKQLYCLYLQGENNVKPLKEIGIIELERNGMVIEYLEFFNVVTLETTESIITTNDYCCLAVICDGVRLIDNYSMKI